jgi:hypothetical protein
LRERADAFVQLKVDFALEVVLKGTSQMKREPLTQHQTEMKKSQQQTKRSKSPHDANRAANAGRTTNKAAVARCLKFGPDAID